METYKKSRFQLCLFLFSSNVVMTESIPWLKVKMEVVAIYCLLRNLLLIAIYCNLLLIAICCLLFIANLSQFIAWCGSLLWLYKYCWMIRTSWIIARRWEQNQAGDSSNSRLKSSRQFLLPFKKCKNSIDALYRSNKLLFLYNLMPYTRQWCDHKLLHRFIHLHRTKAL